VILVMIMMFDSTTKMLSFAMDVVFIVPTDRK